ncbi:glycine/D-amino acid oxidase-like deaminating enzyme [Rhizobium sp. ERR 1071]|uniref:NAD(P)/FAD-dependent oxidoreductase n=1 Tax=Rhizobium sp. ERR 1071 TaxID=2572677 RepID=UPI0011999B47|nr:FAD-binding oxidoreductase [Rhizobium sp. ERR1071]TWB07941.1 glycine/D-amino acid oxidase-like deaminating enzyme [Rhizobium sp. ERR1071]
MLNDARSHGLWERTAIAAPMTCPLSGELTVDVVIVGGGFTGLSAALHLAEAGQNVVVLEGAEIGFGGSGRNVGLINAGMWVMPDDLPGELGDIHGERLLQLLGNGPQIVMSVIDRHGIECELERGGTLHCAVGKAGLAEITERARQWQKRGAPVELLDADETATRIGTTAYAGALLDRRAGTLQPLAYVRGLAHAALRAGAVLHTGSPVLSYVPDGTGWKVSTASGSVSAGWVVVASDAYSDGPWTKVRREQVHLPYFNLATRPLPSELRNSILPGREGAWDTKEILSSFRMDKAGRLVFGSVGALRNTGTAVHVGWAKRALARLFPQLGPIEFEYEWYGKIGMTDNALPRFHRFEQNIVGFSGYNGRGIAPGTVFGQILARHILGELQEGDLPLPITDAKEQPFRAFKEYYYELGAQLAHFSGERL